MLEGFLPIGHANTPWELLPGGEPWISPQKVADTTRTNVGPGVPLITDMNDWSTRCGRSVVPHARGGVFQTEGDFSNTSASGASSADLGARGGNIGHLDGSVVWRDIKKMKLRRGSQRWGPDGCRAMG